MLGWGTYIGVIHMELELDIASPLLDDLIIERGQRMIWKRKLKYNVITFGLTDVAFVLHLPVFSKSFAVSYARADMMPTL